MYRRTTSNLQYSFKRKDESRVTLRDRRAKTVREVSNEVARVLLLAKVGHDVSDTL